MVSIEDMKALKQLGMRWLVMGNNGTAFASERKFKINKENNCWEIGYKNRFTKTLFPEKLNNYCDNWKESVVDHNNECGA